MIKTEALRRRERRQALLTVVFTIISVIYLMPVLLVLINSLRPTPLSTPRPSSCPRRNPLWG